jgi:glycerol transport system ATP-binding protein
MAQIALKRVAHSYDPWPQKPADYAIRKVDLQWADGAVHALVGPEGCGKTTLLETISGLIEPSNGRVLFDGSDVTGLTPAQRNIAHVFRDPVVYDTMTVLENLAFPLRIRGLTLHDIRPRIDRVAQLLDLGADLERPAKDLDIEARHRTALGRALVRDDAAAILLNDPLAAMTIESRRRFRRDLRLWRGPSAPTLVYATDNSTEAMALADQVTVMRQGEVVQSGTPRKLMETPKDRYVGQTIGEPGMNFMPCRIDGDRAVVENLKIPLAPGLGSRAAQTGKALELGIRPEYLRFSAAMVGGAVQVNLVGIADHGAFKLVTARVGKLQLIVKVPGHELIPGRQGWLIFPPERTIIFAAGEAIS